MSASREGRRASLFRGFRSCGNGSYPVRQVRRDPLGDGLVSLERAADRAPGTGVGTTLEQELPTASDERADAARLARSRRLWIAAGPSASRKYRRGPEPSALTSTLRCADTGLRWASTTSTGGFSLGSRPAASTSALGASSFHPSGSTRIDGPPTRSVTCSGRWSSRRESMSACSGRQSPATTAGVSRRRSRTGRPSGGSRSRLR